MTTNTQLLASLTSPTSLTVITHNTATENNHLSPPSYPTLQAETLQSAAMYVASGIDPDRSKIFVQSHVRAHAEMAWFVRTLISCMYICNLHHLCMDVYTLFTYPHISSVYSCKQKLEYHRHVHVALLCFYSTNFIVIHTHSFSFYLMSSLHFIYIHLFYLLTSIYIFFESYRLLNCITPMNWLERMIQFKEKATKQGISQPEF